MATTPTPDPAALAVAAAMQRLLGPAQIILNGSRAVGEHRPDSDVDLMAVFDDDAARILADEVLSVLLECYDDGPEVHVHTTTRAEFEELAIRAQSFPGQAARHGVTPEGKSLGYLPPHAPTAAELKDGADFWRQLGLFRLREFQLDTDEDRAFSWRIAPLHAQYAMQWAIKRLLYLADDPVRYRRDIAVMWRHIQQTNPVTAPDRVEAVERLLAATAEDGGETCALTPFIIAFRRHHTMPVLDGERWEGVRIHLEPAFRALMAEADDREAAL